MTDGGDGTLVDPGYLPPPETRPPDYAPQPAVWPNQQPWPVPPSSVGYPSPPYSDGRPPRRRGRRLVLPLAAGVIGVLVSTWMIDTHPWIIGRHSSPHPAADSGSPGHRLTVPSRSTGYTRITGNVANRMAKATIDQMTAASPRYRASYAKAKIGVYSHPGVPGPALVFIGLAAADDAVIARELRTRSASQEVDAGFLGAGISNTTDVDAGPLGGVMRCADQAEISLCVWADRSSLGLVLITKYTGRRESGRIAVDFRKNAEH